MADNLGPTPVHNIDSHYLLRKQFSVAIEATIFRIDRRAIEVQRLQSIFTLSLFIQKRRPKKYSLLFRSQRHDLQRASEGALVALEAIGMQIANLLATRLVRRQLHRADAGAILALGLTCTRNMDIGERSRQRSLLRRYPTRNSSHRAERTPSAWRIDEQQRHAHDGGHNNDCPKHTSHVTPTVCRTQLDAEHGEYEEHHKQAEAERTHKTGNRTMWRILRQQAIVNVASWTSVSTPPSTFPDARQYRTKHANNSQQSYHGEEPSKDEVGKENPIERLSWSLKMTIKTLFLLFHN